MTHAPTSPSLRLHATINSVLIAAALTLPLFLRPTHLRLEYLDVQRINVVESDGRVRIVLANAARQADAVVEGHVVVSGRDRPAGILFFNEEGSEAGGLVFSGRKEAGSVAASSGLTLDRYNQDQTVQIDYSEDGAHYQAGLRVTDRPTTSLALVADLMRQRDNVKDPLERARIEAQMMEVMGIAAERVFVGRTHNGEASIVLSDSASRPRLVLRVTHDGNPVVEFLNARGDIIRALHP